MYRQQWQTQCMGKNIATHAIPQRRGQAGFRPPARGAKRKILLFSWPDVAGKEGQVLTARILVEALHRRAVGND